MSPTKYREMFGERMAVNDQQIATKDGPWFNRTKRGKKIREGRYAETTDSRGEAALPSRR